MSDKRRNVLVVGGTGNFGARICRRLLNEPEIRLFVSSRSEKSAQHFVSELQQLAPRASITGVALDHHSASFGADMQSLKPHVVVHTAGPFQGQGYEVAKACVASGSHYVDLADARRFVDGFPSALHRAAEDADVLLVTGASSLPGVSSAVVRELADGWQSVDKLDISIAPAQQTPRGISTIRAVLSYCGKPVDVLVDGHWHCRYGWQSLKLQRYSNLGWRLSAVCDVPDLTVFPQRLPTLDTVVFRAALESKLEHIALWLFAVLTRIGIVRDWARFAGLFSRLSRMSPIRGGDVGGMQVTIEGRDREGKPTRCRWNLVAGHNHGPEIPVSPALVLVRMLVRDTLPLRGAHCCFGMMSLQDFAREVAQLDIHWSMDSAPMKS